MKNFLFRFFIIILSTAILYSNDFKFSFKEQASINRTLGWDYNYIDIRNGSNFAYFASPENFNSEKEIKNYEIRIHYNSNSKTAKSIKAYYLNNFLINRVYESNEIESTNYYYDNEGKVIGSDFLKVIYEDNKKIIKTDNIEICYYLKLFENGYRILIENLQDCYSKKRFRDFIIKDGLLQKVIEGNILQSGKETQNLVYLLEYTGKNLSCLKTINHNGSIRSEQKIQYLKDEIHIKEINYSNKNSVIEEKEWILSNFDKGNNWLKGVCIINNKEETVVNRIINYNE